MTKLINSIEHRKCHRKQNKQQDRYDIELKRTELKMRIYDLRRSMSARAYESIDREIEYRIRK